MDSFPANDRLDRDVTPPRDAAIIVREAEPQDGAALVEAFEQISHETDFLGAPGERAPWSSAPEAHLCAIAASGDEIYIVATHRGAIVGYLGAFRQRFTSCRGAIYIFAIGLRESHRGRGLGGRLLAAVEDWARARTAWRLELRVVVENQRALALYQRCGFEIEGRMADTFRIGGVSHDTYWMAKRLTDAPAARPAPFDLMLGRTPYPPAVEVRPLRRGDGAALQQFERDLLDGPPLFLKASSEVAPDVAQIETQIVELIEARLSHVLVAIDGQQRIVAHGGVWREPWSRLAHDAFFQLNVLRPWWGCGIGRQLAGRLEDWAQAQKLARLSAGLQAHNLRGLRFAALRGFHRETVSPDYARLGGFAIDRVRLMRPVG